jgi:sugar lactone lactonase YvrE
MCLLERFDSTGNLFLSDIVANRIYRMAPDGTISIYRDDSGRTNGNSFDKHGFLISCEGAELGPGGRRWIICTDLVTH